MNPHFPLALLLATAAASHPTGAANLPPEVSEVLSRALAVPGARIVPLGWAPQLPAGCVLRQAVLDGTVSGSGRLPVKTVRARVYGLGLGTLRGMGTRGFHHAAGARGRALAGGADRRGS